MSSITASKQGPGKAPMLIAAGAALALIIGIVAWQIADRDDGTATTGTAPTAAEQPTGASRAASDAPATAEPAMVYIVATEAEAERLQLAFADADNVRHQLGLPPLDVSVMVAATQDEHDQVLRLVAEINADRDAEGLGTHRVRDLRDVRTNAAPLSDSGDYYPAADPWVGP